MYGRRKKGWQEVLNGRELQDLRCSGSRKMSDLWAVMNSWTHMHKHPLCQLWLSPSGLKDARLGWRRCSNTTRDFSDEINCSCVYGQLFFPSKPTMVMFQASLFVVLVLPAESYADGPTEAEEPHQRKPGQSDPEQPQNPGQPLHRAADRGPSDRVGHGGPQLPHTHVQVLWAGAEGETVLQTHTVPDSLRAECVLLTPVWCLVSLSTTRFPMSTSPALWSSLWF